MFYAQSTRSAVISGRFSSGLITLLVCVKLCVCSSHILHHKCCSVSVISRVEIVFYTTLNVFKSYVIPSHHTKRFYITPLFTSHQSTSHHHCTFHISDILHLTLHGSLPPTTISHHHIHNYFTPHPHSTSQHISHHIPHYTTTSDITTHCIFFHM